MACENQSCSSISWKPGSPGLKRPQATRLSAKVMIVAKSAIQRALRLVASRLAGQQEDEGRPEERQDQEAREDPRTGHQSPPPNRYQVASAATPSSIAKAY